MGRPKSLLSTVEVDEVKRAHTCRASGSHELAKGDRRLTVHEDGKELHYCVACAIAIVERDMSRLQELRSTLTQA
jgi:hypothetical protein